MFLVTTLLLFAVLISSNGQQLNVLDRDKLCTQWIAVTGTQINTNIDTSLCTASLDHELRLNNGAYFVRFCCPFKRDPATTVGPAVLGTCGRASVTPLRTRIVGGREAAAHSWPWLVSLQYDESHFCGGTLIDEHHILTAAHCLQDRTMDFARLTVVGGLHRRSNVNSGNTQRVRIARFFNHERYNDDTNENDVAVIRLAMPMKLNSYVNIACLPGREPSRGESVMIAGWGATSWQGRASDLLLQASVVIMDNCPHVYQFDSSKQICAGNHEYTKDSCQGDSGGPLMNEVNGQWYVSGVVSYGEECAKQGYPGVYARVSHYLPWIRSKVALG